MISFVYVIGSQDNPVKIGHGSRVESRLTAMQVGNPDELHILARVVVPWDRAGVIEKAVHERLWKHHRRGEWFNVTAAEAVAAIEQALKADGDDKERARYQASYLEEILETYTLHPWAPHAMRHYHVQINTVGRTEQVKQMHSVIAQKAGTAALLAFQTFQKRRTNLVEMKRRDPVAFRKACEAVVEAINALSIWYASAQRRGHLDKISGKAA